MGVYIHEMEMPARCDECRLRHIGLARCNVTGRSTSHYSSGKPMDQTCRPNWCPLIKVIIKAEEEK